MTDKKTIRIAVMLSEIDQRRLNLLASHEELPVSVLIRRLVRARVEELGLMDRQ